MSGDQPKKPRSEIADVVRDMEAIGLHPREADVSLVAAPDGSLKLVYELKFARWGD